MGTRKNRLGEAVLTCTTIYVLSRNTINIRIFYLKINIFGVVKFSVYLNRLVFVKDRFSAILKDGNFSDFQFAFLHTRLLLKKQVLHTVLQKITHSHLRAYSERKAFALKAAVYFLLEEDKPILTGLPPTGRQSPVRSATNCRQQNQRSQVQVPARSHNFREDWS